MSDEDGKPEPILRVARRNALLDDLGTRDPYTPKDYSKRVEERRREKEQERKKKGFDPVVVMFRKAEPAAIRTIKFLMRNSPDEEMRFKCALYIIDRARGKIPEPAKVVSGPQGGPIQIEQRIPLAQLLGLDQPDAKPGPVIEHEKADDDD